MSCEIKRVLTVQNPIRYSTIRLWSSSKEITRDCLYSWSVDRVCWTDWTDIDTYKDICSRIDGDFFIRVLIYEDFEKISIDDSLIDCYSLSIYKQNPYTTDVCGNTLDLYSNLDCAMLLQQQISDLICCTVGIPVYYFRTSADVSTRDLSFKEYVLHNVTDMKYLKLLSEDGQMPSSKPTMTEFDFDWESDWEVECSKSAFATAFGDTAFPKQRDMIYIPLMKRMYEVNAAYDEKQEAFMWRSTTWKLALVKWTDKTNVNQSDFQPIIDDLIVNKITDVLPVERTEQERESGTAQVEPLPFIPSNLTNIFIQDSVRLQISKDEIQNIDSQIINHGSITVARNMYNFRDSRSAVVYQNKFCGEAGTIMFILHYTPGKYLYGVYDDPVICSLVNIKYIDIRITDDGVSFDKLYCSLDEDRTYLVICRWNRETFTESLNVFEHTADNEQIPTYRLRPSMYRFKPIDKEYRKTDIYNNDFIIREPQQVIAHPLNSTNIRLYDVMLSEEAMIQEALKYSTSNEHCIINDLARPVETGYGYSTR